MEKRSESGPALARSNTFKVLVAALSVLAGGDKAHARTDIASSAHLLERFPQKFNPTAPPPGGRELLHGAYIEQYFDNRRRDVQERIVIAEEFDSVRAIFAQRFLDIVTHHTTAEARQKRLEELDAQVQSLFKTDDERWKFRESEELVMGAYEKAMHSLVEIERVYGTKKGEDFVRKFERGSSRDEVMHADQFTRIMKTFNVLPPDVQERCILMFMVRAERDSHQPRQPIMPDIIFT